ncbi:neuroguidin [Ambystoma mexicanum]|uniref:neuroguidin n=1 Tax=Ambystoma mexicanum TaxID=8296 RepID=UPI0037E95B2B
MDDAPAVVQLLNTLQDQVTGVTAHVQGLTQRIRSGAFSTEKGLSFLEVKNQLLVMYLMDLAHVMLEKTSGRSLADNPSILRLVEIRTVLEKMRPTEQKLKYQIDKLVRAAVTGSVGENDPLRFRPNPDNMMSKVSESDEDDEAITKESGKKSSGKFRKYVPPRLAPVHYDDTEVEREKKVLDRAKKRALSSSVIRELQEQYSEAPEEIREGRGYHMMRQGKEDLHRTHYEESMMVRLNLTRKEKAQKKRAMSMTSQLHSLTHFRDISVLTGGAEGPGEDFVPSAKKHKKTPRRGKKKGFRKRK